MRGTTLSSLHWAAMVTFAIAAAGCGSREPASVHGTVTYNGRPITSGTLTLMGPDNKVATSNIGPDGSYAIDSITPGKVLVAVYSPDPVATLSPEFRAARAGRTPVKSQVTRMPVSDSKWFPLPERLANPDTSEVVIEVNSGSQTLNIETHD
jgi:hypothetical protein